MRVVFPTQEQNALLINVLNERMGGAAIDAQCLAVMDEDELAGIVAFFNFRWPSIEVAFYCDNYRWALNRDGVAEVLSYPFKQLNCHRITAIVDRKDMRARKMVQRLGFKEEGKLRKAGPKGDMFVYGLLPDEFGLRRYENTQSAAAA